MERRKGARLICMCVLTYHQQTRMLNVMLEEKC